MPIVFNHKGPSFREYTRTPAENKIIELEGKVSDMEKALARLLDKQASQPEDSKESSTDN